MSRELNSQVLGGPMPVAVGGSTLNTPHTGPLTSPLQPPKSPLDIKPNSISISDEKEKDGKDEPSSTSTSTAEADAAATALVQTSFENSFLLKKKKRYWLK